VRDEQFSGCKTVFNKSWYFSSDIPSLKMNDCDDAEYDEQDEFFYDVDDNNNDVESRQEIDENVES
jgi:hypothetical protein